MFSFLSKGAILLSLWGAANGQTQEASGYLWPTDASEYLTSAFGEYRPRRYHTGIDVKTWGRTGYKCFAVRPGYVWRVGVSPYGYGKVLYLKLDTGEVAVYAHLSGFNDKIEEHIEREQQRTGKYRVNIFLKPELIPVAQGDVIAYTGQTGIGAPHLHFEIRDRANRPTNPLLKGYRLPDTVSPILSKVSFSPLDANSDVNGDFKPLVTAPRWLRPGEYIIPETVKIWGNVGLGVIADDKGNDGTNDYGVYRLRLFVDEVLQFSYQFDLLNFQTNSMVELEREYRLNRRSQGRFYKLYKDQFNENSYYRPNKTWAGVLQSVSLSASPNLIARPQTPLVSSEVSASGDLLPGEHPFRIEVEDFFGNTSLIRGRIQVAAAFDIQPVIQENPNGALALEDVATYDLEQLKALDLFVLSQNNWRPVQLNWPLSIDNLSEKGGDGPEMDTREVVPAMPLPSFGGASSFILKFQGVNQFGRESYPYYFVRSDVVANSPPPELDIVYDFYDTYVRLEVTSQHVLRKIPALRLYPTRSDETTMPLHQTDLKKWICRIPFDDLRGKVHTLSLDVEGLNGEPFSVLKQFVAEKIAVGVTDRLASEDQQMWVSFSPNSLYRPIYPHIEIDSLSVAAGHEKVGHIYSVSPGDALMRNGAYVHIRYPHGTPNPDKLGVCYKSRWGNWIFIDNKLDESNHSVSARVLSFEDFTLLRDEVAPEVTNIQPPNNVRLRNNTPLISVNIQDRFSGINSENDLEIRLDGERLIAEYDPERDRLSHKVKRPLTKGQHEIVVLAVDRCKNVTIKKTHFWVE